MPPIFYTRDMGLIQVVDDLWLDGVRVQPKINKSTVKSNVNPFFDHPQGGYPGFEAFAPAASCPNICRASIGWSCRPPRSLNLLKADFQILDEPLETSDQPRIQAKISIANCT